MHYSAPTWEFVLEARHACTSVLLVHFKHESPMHLAVWAPHRLQQTSSPSPCHNFHYDNLEAKFQQHEQYQAMIFSVPSGIEL
jgi:seryl-tRNA synthetase